MSVTERWSRFPTDPRLPANRDVRAGDADRAVALDWLGEAYAQGKLDGQEHSDRVEAVQAAKTLGALVPTLQDLSPPGSGLRLDAPRSAELRQEAKDEADGEVTSAIAAFISASVICWGIWIALGGDMFMWPLIVSAATGANLVRALLQRQTRAKEIERKLRRGERPGLRSPGED